MRIDVIGYPMIFYSDGNDKSYHPYELSDQIIVNYRIFNQLLEEFGDESVLFMNLVHKKSQVSYLVTLGSPHKENDNIIFIPEWIMDYMGCSHENGPEFYVEKAEKELDVATKIKIRIMDNEILNGDMDVCGYFERALMNLHSIQDGLTLPIYMEEYGENVLAYIEKVEPSICSKIVTGEVEVEFVSTTEESISPSKPLSPSFESLSSSSTYSSSPHSTIQVPPNTPLLSSSFDTLPSLSSLSQSIPSTDEKYDSQDTFFERQQKIRQSWAKRFSS
jgi:hypothetical protein